MSTTEDKNKQKVSRHFLTTAELFSLLMFAVEHGDRKQANMEQERLLLIFENCKNIGLSLSVISTMDGPQGLAIIDVTK